MGVWDSFGEGSGFAPLSSATEGLAKQVLDKFNIPNGGHDNTGGSLSGVDIVHMDAMSVISASLLEATAMTGNIYELVTTANEDIKIKCIGSGSSSCTCSSK